MSIQGHLLEITVVGCTKLKDTEWLSRQDPYVVLEYAGSKYRTKTDTDGGKNPTFNEKYMLPLIEGLREVNVTVWNSNTVSLDDFIGSGKILLQKVLSDGYDDCSWPLTSRTGKRSGEVRIIMHYSNLKEKRNSSTSTAPAMYAAPPSHPSGHSGYPPAYAPYPTGGHPAQGPYCAGGYPAAPAYPPAPAYSPYGTYPPQVQPPQAYQYPPPGAYPPQGYPYPPQGYPPQHGYGAPPPSGYPPY